MNRKRPAKAVSTLWRAEGAGLSLGMDGSAQSGTNSEALRPKGRKWSVEGGCRRWRRSSKIRTREIANISARFSSISSADGATPYWRAAHARSGSVPSLLPVAELQPGSYGSPLVQVDRPIHLRPRATAMSLASSCGSSGRTSVISKASYQLWPDSYGEHTMYLPLLQRAFIGRRGRSSVGSRCSSSAPCIPQNEDGELIHELLVEVRMGGHAG